MLAINILFKVINKRFIKRCNLRYIRSHSLRHAHATLLLAYMGSFIGVMMVYMAQGTPLMSILNTKFISSEIVQTFVGCIGLVIVSPLTSLICSIIYTKKHKL